VFLPGEQEEVDEQLLVGAVVELRQRVEVPFVPVERRDEVDET